jgi:dienelactone hydrolase
MRKNCARTFARPSLTRTSRALRAAAAFLIAWGTLAVLPARGAALTAGPDTVTIPASATNPALLGYFKRPAAPGPAPAILVLHGCGGFGAREITWVDTFAAQGYVALAIDTLTPQGLTNGCGNAESSYVGSHYAATALRWLAAQPSVDATRLGLLGSSEGAIETLDIVDPRGAPIAVPAGLRAAVAYYPACSRRDPDVLVPLQILDGDADDWTPAPPCGVLATAATAAGKTVLITTYPGATHDFNVPSDRAVRYSRGHRLVYDPAAAQDALTKTIAFFAHYLH